MPGTYLNFLQSADRLLGPLLCRGFKPQATKLTPIQDAAGLVQHSKPIAPDEVRRILVIRPGGIGDAVLTYPMLQALRRGYPEADIDVLAEKRNVGVYEIADLVSALYCYDTRSLSVARRLRRTHYDVIIDTEQYHHLSTIFANFLRPKYLCGFDTLGRRRFQTHSVAYYEETYEVFSFLGLADAVIGSSADFDTDRAFIEVNAEARAWAAHTLAPAAGRYIVAVTPIASGPTRLWPIASFIELIRWLTSREYYVVLLGGCDGNETANHIMTQSSPETVLNLVGKTSLPQTAAVLQQVCLSVSPDTGVVHLAYGVGTSTVSLFGSGLHLKWGPPGRHHRIVRKGLACSPCIRFGRVPRCPYDVACMREIDVIDVIASIEYIVRTQVAVH